MTKKTEYVLETGRPTLSRIMPELNYFTSRSSGPGGQHVNKVESKVMIKWNVRESEVLSEEEKELLIVTCGNRINKSGELMVSSENKRSQLRNKEFALKKLEKLLVRAFTRKKKRVATKPSRAANRKRLDSKKRHSGKKELRKRVEF